MAPRRTKADYDAPWSFDRIREAAYALADVDTDKAGDAAFHRADMRLRSAVKGYMRQALERLTNWQRKGGRARAAGMSPERRSEVARGAARARWDRGACKQASTPKHETDPRDT